MKKDTQIDIGLSNTDNSTKIGLGQWTPKEKSLEEYDSVQHSLPSQLQDGFIKNNLIRKTLKLEESGHFGDDFGRILIKNIPKVFFILLPFFALLLKLIFFRKKYFYVDHIIFSIHFHSFGFIIGLLLLIISQIPFINEYSGLLILLFALSLTIYLALSLKKVYPSPWWKIILKQIVLFLAYFICFIFLMALVSIYTYFTL